MNKSPGDLLLLRYLEGNCTPEEQRFVEEWLMESSDNAVRFRLFVSQISNTVFIDEDRVKKEVLSRTGLDASLHDAELGSRGVRAPDIKSEPVTGPVADHNTGSGLSYRGASILTEKKLAGHNAPDRRETTFEKGETNPGKRDTGLTNNRKKNLFHAWIPAAAVILMALTSAYFSYHWQSEQAALPEVVQNEIIEQVVPAGTSKTLTLSDGTRVHLNSGSILRFSENFASQNESRDVYLEGEAYFEVTNRGDKPFIVRSAELETTVLGTAFNVKAYPDDGLTQVVVAEGLVSVKQSGTEKSSDESLMLEPNQWVTFDTHKKTIQKENGDIRKFIAWKEGVLLFDDHTVAEVSSILERWYDTTIQIENEEVKNCQIHGEYQDRSLETVLKMMQFTLDIAYEFVDDRGVRITGGGCR